MCYLSEGPENKIFLCDSCAHSLVSRCQNQKAVL